VRHRATHDDLPPLPLLLTSIHLAIDYLNHFAFLPLLSSSSEATGSAVSPAQAQAAGLVKRWKKVMKVRVSEKIVGEENPSGRELRTIRRDFDVVDVEDIVGPLCTVGGLVPVARK
jgi:ribosomal biogenesis protein LAS1